VYHAHDTLHVVDATYAPLLVDNDFATAHRDVLSFHVATHNSWIRSWHHGWVSAYYYCKEDHPRCSASHGQTSRAAWRRPVMQCLICVVCLPQDVKLTLFRFFLIPGLFCGMLEISNWSMLELHQSSQKSTVGTPRWVYLY